MMMVNRTPVDEDTLAAIKASYIHGEEAIGCAISTEDVDTEGERLIRSLQVEGEPADGITLHGTRWGRKWCAYTYEEQII